MNSFAVSQAYVAQGSDLLVQKKYQDHGYASRTMQSRAACPCLPEDVTALQALELAGLNWKVEKAVPQIMTPNGISYAENSTALYRSDTGKILGIHSDAYEPVQNTTIAAIFDSLGSRAVIESALSCRDGRRIYVTARIDAEEEITPGDRLRRYLHVFNSHDGGTSFGAFFTTQRLACANQMSGNIRRAGRKAKDESKAMTFKHTRGVQQFAEELPQRIDMQRLQFRSEVESLRDLTRISMTEELARRILEVTYADKLATPIRDKQTGQKRPRHLYDLKERREILTLADGLAHGSELPGFRGSAWGFLNSITEYETHGGNLSNPEKARKRLEALYNGAAGHRIELARNACLALV